MSNPNPLLNVTTSLTNQLHHSPFLFPGSTRTSWPTLPIACRISHQSQDSKKASILRIQLRSPLLTMSSEVPPAIGRYSWESSPPDFSFLQIRCTEGNIWVVRQVVPYPKSLQHNQDVLPIDSCAKHTERHLVWIVCPTTHPPPSPPPPPPLEKKRKEKKTQKNKKNN